MDATIKTYLWHIITYDKLQYFRIIILKKAFCSAFIFKIAKHEYVTDK